MWHRVAGALRGARVLEVYCDGSAEGRVGQPGGWAFVIVREDTVLLEESGRADATTSLVMELEAARAALEAVLAHDWQSNHSVELISDSSIALDVAAGRFMPRRYVPLARALRAAAVLAGAQTRWVRAHSGHRWNERADEAAARAKERR